MRRSSSFCRHMTADPFRKKNEKSLTSQKDTYKILNNKLSAQYIFIQISKMKASLIAIQLLNVRRKYTF